MIQETDLLIVGAGPFGLGMAAYCQQFHIDYLMVGKPMDFWISNMPKQMYLRSDIDWHLDPAETHTIENFISSQNIELDEGDVLSRDFYLEYTQWFGQEKNIEALDFKVVELVYEANHKISFTARLDNGGEIKARNVVVATGFKHFKHQPPEYLQMFPADRLSHTCDLVEFDHLRGRRCLIIGGRQSAFEWAALLHESGAEQTYLCYRHETPQFTESDWSWVNSLMERFAKDGTWYQELSDMEKEELNQKFWVEGRLKLEPWLFPRINHDSVKLFPNATVTDCRQLPDQSLEISFSQGQKLTVDVVILATGYQVDIDKIPFLLKGNILDQLITGEGFPKLDQHLQSSIPGLYFTSMAATRDFGSFFAFTVSVKVSSILIGRHLRSKPPLKE